MYWVDCPSGLRETRNNKSNFGMSDSEQQETESIEVCPVGEDYCRYIDQLQDLRRDVEALSELVVTDALTDLYNFRHFMHALDVEMERTNRSTMPTALIMLDIDDFKRLNDRHGHEAGNAVLAAIGRMLHSTCRKLDMSCRYGGEEFTVILPSTRLDDAVGLAHRLHRELGRIMVDWHGEPLSVTASFGVASYRLGDPASASDFIERCDARLRAAKRAGKNRVFWPHGVTGETSHAAVS